MGVWPNDECFSPVLVGLSFSRSLFRNGRDIGLFEDILLGLGRLFLVYSGCVV